MKFVLKLIVLSGLIVSAGLGVSWGIREVLEQTSAEVARDVPTAPVRRGAVTITVNARGDIRGSSSESFMTPQTGELETPVVFLRQTGEWVEEGEVVVEFDTTAQEFKLREAEADLEEAEQVVVQTQAEAQASLEEARYQMIAAEADVRVAEQEIRKNELLAAVEARRNEIALEQARNRYRQAQEDYENQQASLEAGIEIKQTDVNRARQEAESARRNIENSVMRAKSSGYVQPADYRGGTTILTAGMSFPKYRQGDPARPGQLVASIPGLESFEVSARIPETDRGYLEIGQEVIVKPAALPGRELRGHVTVLGGSSGYAYNRTFECRVALEETDPGLRPGMSANVEITVTSLDDVLWIPSQALFENDGRAFVYTKTELGYVTRDVELVRRSESQAVIAGIEEGTEVALASPDQQRTSEDAGAGALGALP